jgi:hypothetical protein
MRQQYTLQMLPLLLSCKRVINVDESWISETNYSRRMWYPADAACTVA